MTPEDLPFRPEQWEAFLGALEAFDLPGGASFPQVVVGGPASPGGIFTIAQAAAVQTLAERFPGQLATVTLLGTQLSLSGVALRAAAEPPAVDHACVREPAAVSRSLRHTGRAQATVDVRLGVAGELLGAAESTWALRRRAA